MMPDITIDRTIPLPVEVPKDATESQRIFAALQLLEVGDSFTVPYSKILRVKAFNCVRKLDIAITTRREGLKLRVWRKA